MVSLRLEVNQTTNNETNHDPKTFNAKTKRDQRAADRERGLPASLGGTVGARAIGSGDERSAWGAKGGTDRGANGLPERLLRAQSCHPSRAAGIAGPTRSPGALKYPTFCARPGQRGGG